MEALHWIFPALFAALAWAGMVLINEHMRVRSLHMLLWMRGMTVLVLLPGAFLISWPGDWRFYALMLVNSLIIAYTDLVKIGLPGKNGAGVVSRLEPISHGVIFFLWLVVTPSLVSDYLDTPLRAFGIVISICSCIFFALRLKKCPVSFSALKTAFPAIMISGVAIVAGRLGMDYSIGEGVEPVYQYVAIQCVTVSALYFIFQSVPFLSGRIPHMELDSSIFDKKVLLAGILATLAWLAHTPAKWYAIMQVENPAYVTIIMLSAPLWVLLFYRLKGKREEADVRSGLGIVASAAALVFFAQS